MWHAQFFSYFFISWIVLNGSPYERDYGEESLLAGLFSLGGECTQKTQYFLMNTEVIQYALNGESTGTDRYTLHLKWTPEKLAGANGDVMTCSRFTYQKDDNPESTIPSLKDWTYVFTVPEKSGIDEKGQTLGIDHAPFENLTDEAGNVLPIDKAYSVYNSFIDFHSFSHVLGGKASEGKDISALKTIGQKIVHSAAYTEAPVNLGSQIKKGSTFRNGEIVLELKGLSLINGKSCAIVGFDSGNSAFQMIMEPMAGMEVKTVGASHYQGELYIDLKTNWIQKVTMHELVVSETDVPAIPQKMNAVIERIICIRNVSLDGFGK